MKYGYNDGLKGLEADYWVIHDTLHIQLWGSNHWTDYVKNFFAWPRKKIGTHRVHRFWYNLAKDLVSKLPVNWGTITHVKVIGHSLGGAVASILPFFLGPRIGVEVLSINAPKSGYTDSTHKAYYDKGDIVRHLPLLYPRYRKRLKYADTKPFWSAHDNFPGIWFRFKSWY